MDPLISVIMPVFNGELYLRESLMSLLSQTYRNFELLVLNDGSSDHSEEIIQEFANKDARIIQVKSKVNKGLIATLNHGLALAKGTYIARADHDDICTADRFEKQLRFMENNPEVGICSAWFEFIGEKNGRIELPPTDDAIKIFFLDKCAICHPLMFARGSVFAKNKQSYDETAFACEDYDLWTRLAAQVRFANLPEVLLKYRITPGQMSAKYSDSQQKNSTRCKTRMLRYAFQPADETQGRLMEIIVNHQHISELADLAPSLMLLNDIEKANDIKNFFDAALFRKYISEKKKNLVLYFYHNKQQFNLASLIELLRLPRSIKEQMTAAEQMKICIKSLTFYKRTETC